ncbi:unnamed protein product [Cochlearia groenlandica]
MVTTVWKGLVEYWTNSHSVLVAGNCSKSRLAPIDGSFPYAEKNVRLRRELQDTNANFKTMNDLFLIIAMDNPNLAHAMPERGLVVDQELEVRPDEEPSSQELGRDVGIDNFDP